MCVSPICGRIRTELERLGMEREASPLDVTLKADGMAEVIEELQALIQAAPSAPVCGARFQTSVAPHLGPAFRIDGVIDSAEEQHLFQVIVGYQSKLLSENDPREAALITQQELYERESDALSFNQPDAATDDPATQNAILTTTISMLRIRMSISEERKAISAARLSGLKMLSQMRSLVRHGGVLPSVTVDAVLATLSVTVKYAPVVRPLLDYLHRERVAAGDDGLDFQGSIDRSFSDRDHVAMATDAREQKAFQAFAQSLRHLDAGVLDTLLSVPIDWAPGRPDGPVVLVMLDIHPDIARQWGLMHDLALLSPQDPLIAWEGTPHDEVESSQDYAEILRKNGQLLMTVGLLYLRQLRFSVSSFAQGTAAFLESAPYSLIALGCMSSAAVIREMATATALRVGHAVSGDEFHDSANWIGSCFYQGRLHYVGLEDGLAWPESGEEKAPSPLMNMLEFVYRSRFAVRAMTQHLTQAQRPLGIMVYGAGHAAALYDEATRAASKHGINFIFLRETPYSGHLPDEFHTHD